MVGDRGGQWIHPHRLENPRAAQPLLSILPRTQEKIPDECSMPTYGRSGSIEIVARQMYIEQAPPHLKVQALNPSIWLGIRKVSLSIGL